MATCVYVPTKEREYLNPPLDAEQLLRHLGVTGKLVGFRYTIFMVERVARDPQCIQLITKCLYPETACHFGVSAYSVERALRTVIQACWERSDHSFWELIAGVSLKKMPTNTEFIDMLAAYLRRST